MANEINLREEAARDLYVVSGVSVDKIAKSLQLTYGEVDKWKVAGGWALARREYLKGSILELRDRALERLLAGSEGFQNKMGKMLDRLLDQIEVTNADDSNYLALLERTWKLGKEVYGIDIAREAAHDFVTGKGDGVTYQNMMQINNNLLNAAVSDRVLRSVSSVEDLA